MVLCDKRRFTLTEDCYLLLYVLDLVLGLFQVDDLDGDDALRPVVDPLEDLTERALADAVKLGKQLLRICLHVLQEDIK